MVGLRVDALGLSVDDELDGRAVHRADRVDCLVQRIALRHLARLLHEVSVVLLHGIHVVVLRELRIAPVPDEHYRGVFGLHHAEDVEVHLRQPHGVDASGRAAVLAERLASVLVGVGPAQRRDSRVRLRAASARARPVELRVLLRRREREVLLRLVVDVEARLLLAAVQIPAAVVVVRRRVVVPRAARRLLARVLRLHHRHELPERLHRIERRHLVAVEHRADVLRLRDLLLRLQRAAAHEAESIRVDLFLELDHLLHVRRGNLVVARLPEDDGRRIAEVDHRVAHRLYTMRPGASGDIALLVARGRGVDDAELVVRAHRRGLGRDVHPADEVCVRLAD